MPIIDSLRRAARKPPYVIAYRGIQEARFAWMQRSGGWQRLEHSIENWWTGSRVDQLTGGRSSLVAADARSALQRSVTLGLTDSDAIMEEANAIAERRFSVLGAAVPAEGPWPWHSDWRFGHDWPPAYFKSYDFYERRSVPFDVKYPWEISRLTFLLPLAQAALLARDPRLAREALTVVNDWKANNPFAHSVNWYPMEASMRGVSLLLIFELLLASGVPPFDLRPLVVLLSMHGEFVARTLEYTDVRGNHYAANIACLLLLGVALSRAYPPAGKWAANAARIVPREIELQILPDGIDFEKSISYHRLVTELFLVSLIAADRSGIEVPQASVARLRAAVEYSNTYTRANGWTPNLGDNDDARVLHFDRLGVRDHRPLAALGAAFFHVSEAKPENFFSSSIPMLLGHDGMEAFRRLKSARKSGTTYFRDGGVVVSQTAKHYLIVDVGEVGLKGRGGHGHNDLFSFELVLDDVPLVVEAGSYMYTGDLEGRQWFQSTAAHNGLRVDETEIAAILGTWSIASTAHPQDVSISSEGGTATIRAAHDGYRSLSDPVLHTRQIEFDAARGWFECIDRIEASSDHVVERFLHFSPGTEVSLANDDAEIASDGHRYHLRWNPTASCRVEDVWYSPSYGVRHQAPCIVLLDKTHGSWSGTLTISIDESERGASASQRIASVTSPHT